MTRLQSFFILLPAVSVLFGEMVASAPTDLNSTAVQPQLEYLFQATVNVGERVQFGSGPGPLGTRVSFPILGGNFSGPAISGDILPIGADWGLVDAKGEFAVDAYYQLRTTDNVDIFARSQGPPQTANTGDRLRTRIGFETGDENYYWVNNMLVVGITTVYDNYLTIDAWQTTIAD